MSMVRASSLRFLVGLVALLAFGADVLDDVSDRAQQAQCSQTSQSGNHQKQSCPNCGCPIHGEAAVISDVAVPLPLYVPEAGVLRSADELALSGLPAAIDHPPQLA